MNDYTYSLISSDKYSTGALSLILRVTLRGRWYYIVLHQGKRDSERLGSLTKTIQLGSGGAEIGTRSQRGAHPIAPRCLPLGKLTQTRWPPSLRSPSTNAAPEGNV